MDEKLKAVLAEGETIKWTGRPEASKLLEKPFGTRLYTTWIVAAAVLIVSCIVLLPLIITSEIHRVTSIALFIALNIAPLTMSVQPINDLKRLQEKTLYAITDRRVLVISKNEVMSLVIDNNTKIAVENRANGTGNVCFNAAIGKNIAKSRVYGLRGVRETEGVKAVIGLVFYNVKNPDAVGGYLMSKAV